MLKLIWAVIAFFLAAVSVAAANGFEDPYPVLLQDPFPSATAPFELLTSNFLWEGVDRLPSGSRIEWLGTKPQWSRINGRLVLPRARFRLSIRDLEASSLVVAGKHHPLRREANFFVGEATVPLVSGDASKITIHFRSQDRLKVVSLRLRNISREF